VGATGEFVRDTKYLNGRITADGRDGTLPAEAGRYRLVVARACPWANRTMIVRRLLGLEDALSMGICGPEHDPGEVDPVLGIHWLRDAYEKAVPGYDRGVTVPAIVEVAAGAVVTADYRQITLDLEREWAALHRPGAPELYPDKLQDEIEEISAGVYEDVNNGVYRCGFASTQAAYEESYNKLFARLDQLSERLATRRYLPGTRSPRRTCGCGPRWSGSTRSTTATSSATGTRSPRCRCCGRTRGTCTRRQGSATPSTSPRPRSTTTRCTPG
jgi:putative glutathione S-transferase